jgi:peptide-methionine (S)-S-oxide reductase
MTKATFAAGCFWGVEAEFLLIKGVTNTRVGYTGGWSEDPTYESVCTDKTGHSEAVEVEYNPALVSYEELIDTFWKLHDPTTLNRQGPDIGTQYRSAIFCHSPEQLAAAMDSKENLVLSKKYKSPIVTQVVMAEKFTPAEEYHQRYLQKQGIKHCIMPKDDNQ